MGTLYAASTLREEGHDVLFFDNGLEKSTAPFKDFLTSNKPDILVIYEDGFNYLTKMCLTVMREAAFEMASFAKELNIPVFISSSDSTDHDKLYLENGVDAVIRGEGEITLKELCKSSLEKDELNEISGLSFLKNGELIKTQNRQVLRFIDELPDPAWDLLNVKPYQEIWLKNNDYFSLNISTTRGCPYKCNWCAKPIYGNVYNSRSPQRVAKEMAMLQDKFEVDEFWICDDIFGLKRNWVQEFAEEVENAKRTFHYKIQSRVDLMLRDNSLEAMVRSGMEEVWVGAESGSQKILDAMDKGTTVEQIREATKNVKKYGKKICFFLQFGYLGESEEDIEATIDMLLELMPDDIGISVSYPLPGTGFYEKVKSDLQQKANWTDSDDLDLMYKGSFSNSYYKNLHRLVHKLYRKKQGRELLSKPLSDWKNFGASELRQILLSLIYYTPMSKVDKIRSKKLAASEKS